MRTRIKICGITRPEDGLAAARAGADAVGLVFAAGSPRAMSFENARAVTAVLPPFVTVVGLFVDAAPERVRETIGAVRLDLLQFHGAETPEYCRQFSSPYIKAIPMRSDIDLYGQERLYGDAAGLLLDTYVSGVAGGTGESFDWGRIPRDLSKPVILAGGLSPANVGEAVRRARPYAVDVSSGVEQAKGIKDASRILAFVNAVRSVE